MRQRLHHGGDKLTELVPARIPSFGIGTPVIFPRMFTSTECDAMDAAFANTESHDGPVMFETVSQRVCGVRYLEIELLPTRVHGALTELLPAIDKYYGFALSGEFEHCQHCTYAENGRTDWHMDVGYEETEARKLTVVVQLSESPAYDGGELEFFPGHTPAFSRLRGTVIVFPPFLVHRVTPVTRGKRSTMVTWLHGPKFR